ncbi:hypothetical protein [Paludisphaera soli]|uniref:hypothetical protein n=1 Tax=Paludisphaera soli TaxID=2712865 RepID=UPI0013EBB6E7|nr:hypothetical protein [Paludisphaera soli]
MARAAGSEEETVTSLEVADSIDMITRGQDGRLNLVVVDSGLTVDEDDLRSSLLEKLRGYARYCQDDSFSDQYPGVSIAEVQILDSNEMSPWIERGLLVDEYLEATPIVDWDDAEVLALARALASAGWHGLSEPVPHKALPSSRGGVE